MIRTAALILVLMLSACDGSMDAPMDAKALESDAKALEKDAEAEVKTTIAEDDLAPAPLRGAGQNGSQ